MSGYTLDEFATLDHRSTLDVFYSIYEKMSLESLRACLIRIAPPSFWKEEKPDTLMPNSCGICGASFVDHGRLACSDDVCFYGERNKQEEVIQEILERIDPEPAVEVVNTIHEPQEIKPHAPRAPKEAEINWPAMRVKNFIKTMKKYAQVKGETSKRMNHLQGLEYMARQGKMTLEDLLKTSPPAYLDRLGVSTYAKSFFYYGKPSLY
jgi:hypothetical protein